ncbi:NADP-dependent oxidoreductase [Gordonia paraffinivorans]|uniref:NADP-dependent oxidoreductase n=1 Tax=Gordonia paraffinivorans TaxID=175628 RepID=UPI000D64718F|nr:NADP-dependent oxidoreductase [Gordonia paraffinivorans]
MVTSRQVVLVRRPVGTPTADDFALESVEPEAGQGQVLVRNHAMSVEPYMRGRMSDRKSYVPAYELGLPMDGPAVGEVVGSSLPDVPVGTWVRHGKGWREYATLDAGEIDRIEVGPIPATAYLGALGQTGMTAWVGLTRIGAVVDGNTVFVSSAAGAVGMCAARIARMKGAKVIGSCGSPKKAAMLEETGTCDVAFDYHVSPDLAGDSLRRRLDDALTRVGADGIDVYFDNVGGDHLEAAIRRMSVHGRIVMCGAISVYNSPTPVPGPSNLLQLIWRRVRMEGFLVGDHLDAEDEFRAQMSGWLADGSMTSPETVVGQGIEEAVDGFLRMMRGDSTGKALVRL